MATESLSNPGLPLVESSAINLEQSTKEMENQQSGQGMEHQQSTEPDLEKQVTATSQPDEPSSSLDGTAVNSLQPQKTNASQVEYVSGIKMYLALASVTMVVFLMLIDISIIATAVPRITSDFHALNDVGWYGSAYLLANAALQPLTGKFYTYFRVKWTFLTFLCIFELGSLLCGVSTNSKFLICGRAVAGLGGSGLVNGALTIIAASAPIEKRPAMIGIMMGFGQMGVALGPIIGGAFTEYTTWRWCFYVNLPIGGCAAIFIILISLPEQMVKPPVKNVLKTVWQKFDLLGFAIFAPAAIQILLALEYGGNQYAWNSATIIGLFCGGGVTFILFFIWEYRVGEIAMIPYNIIRQRTMWTSCLAVFCLFGTLQCASYYLPIYFQAVKGATPLKSGVDLLPSVISQLIGAVGSGIIVGKMGYYLPWIVACGLLTAISCGLVSTLSDSSGSGKWIGYQIIMGFGRGIGFQMPLIAVQNTLKPSQVAIGMSTIMFCQIFGGAIILAIAETIFDNILKTDIPKFAPGVNPETIITAGATAIRQTVSKAQLPGVLKAYSNGFDGVFYMAAGLGGLLFFVAWGMGFVDIRTNKKKAAPAPAPKPDEENQQQEQEQEKEQEQEVKT